MQEDTNLPTREVASSTRTNTARARPALIHIVHAEGRTLESLDRTQIAELLHKHGTLLFRGFEVSPDDFVEFTKRFCTQFLEHIKPELRPKRDGDNTTAGVIIGNEPVSMHGEMNYLPMRPDILWFYCISPAGKGGETLVADSRDVLAALSDSTRKLFETRRIRYRHTVSRIGWQTNTKQTDIHVAMALMNLVPGCSATALDDDNIQLDFETDGIRPTGRSGEPGFLNSVENVLELADHVPTVVTFNDGEPFSAAVLQDVNRAALGSAQGIQWQAQDLVMIDNSRVMHGRPAFEGEARRIDVRFGMMAPDLK